MARPPLHAALVLCLATVFPALAVPADAQFGTGPAPPVPPQGGPQGNPQGGPPDGPPDGPPEGPPVGVPPLHPGNNPLDPRSPFHPDNQPGTGGAGSAIGVPSDATLWTTWWALHRDLFLDLRRQARQVGPGTGDDGFFLGRGERGELPPSSAPTPTRLRTEVVPGLLALLGRDPGPEVARAGLLALARAAGSLVETPGGVPEKVAPLLRSFVAEGNRSVGEAAVVALGLLGSDAESTTLVALLRDTEAGRDLADASEVPTRHRAFAAYALGLLGERSGREDVHRYIVHHLVAALDEDGSATRDLEVACIAAIGLVPLPDRDGERIGGALVDADDDRGQRAPDASARPAPSSSRAGQLRLVADTLFSGFQDRQVRAHAATSLALLLDDLPAERRDAFKDELAPGLARILEPGRREPNEVILSTILALGEIADADGDAPDRRLRQALVEGAEEYANQEPRFATLVTLGRIGGRPGNARLPSPGSEALESHLLSVLSRGDVRARSWAGLALGVLGHGASAHGVKPTTAGNTALRGALRKSGNAYDAGAYALALGLRRDPLAVPLLLEALEEPGSASWIPRAAEGLGLLGAQEARGALETLLVESGARPDRLVPAAEALVLLGSSTAVDRVLGALDEARSQATREGPLTALGRIGDDRAVVPLLALLGRRSTPDVTLASALAALGNVSAPGDLPWQTSYRRARNVAAAPPTLFDPLALGGPGGLLTLP